MEEWERFSSAKERGEWVELQFMAESEQRQNRRPAPIRKKLQPERREAMRALEIAVET